LPFKSYYSAKNVVKKNTKYSLLLVTNKKHDSRSRANNSLNEKLFEVELFLLTFTVWRQRNSSKNLTAIQANILGKGCFSLRVRKCEMSVFVTRTEDRVCTLQKEKDHEISS
jgi:hypothetical protein